MALLDVQEVSIRFGGLQALDQVSLDVEVGHVTGLIGPNGAGKTTFFNVVTGLLAPNAGRVNLDAKEITRARPHQRARLGIGRTFQRLETFGSLTARENVLVAAETGWSRRKGAPDETTDGILERIGIADVAGERVDRLPTGTARLVELGRALATHPRVLLLDEPSAGLNEGETSSLGSLLRDLAATGLAVLLVEHDMAFVMGTCARIHVLDFGRIIAVGSPAEVQGNPEVRTAYLGEDSKKPAPEAVAGTVIETAGAIADADGATRTAVEGAAPALELRDVTAGYGPIDVLQGVSLSVPVGSVFALLGPNGAGKSTTLKVASGQIEPSGGDVLLHGGSIRGRSADALARVGLCSIPEGRGIFPNLTVIENLRMATYSGQSFSEVQDRALTRFPRLRDRRKQVAGTLSGGEQQMLAMARALATDPKVLLLDELSMGLAPLIVEELYEAVARIVAEDVSILIVEQFAHEVLDVAQTAAIMLHGRIDYTGAPKEIGEQLDAAYLGLSSTN
ncbi:MAG: ATP-binding cassette domain-containing protein [Actinobacteria bacterium]|nr:ATP-binding cassette domain-containing protein [Actinomycetota bacterium]